MTLFETLIAAGLPVASATESGDVSGLPGVSMTLEQMQLMSDICKQYLHPIKWAIEKRIRDRKTSAKIRAIQNILGTMSLEGAHIYLDSHSNNVPDLKGVVGLLMDLILALCDETWPDRLE